MLPSLPHNAMPASRPQPVIGMAEIGLVADWQLSRVKGDTDVGLHCGADSIRFCRTSKLAIY